MRDGEGFAAQAAGPPGDGKGYDMNEHAFSTRDEYLAALDELIRRARRCIRMKDADLRGQSWETPARPALLEGFLRDDRNRRLEILLHDGHYLAAYCPLLMKLLRNHARQVEIRVYEEIAPSEPSYVLGDSTLLLHRHHWESWRGRYSPDDAPGVGALTEQFMADWERSPTTLAYTPLGL